MKFSKHTLEKLNSMTGDERVQTAFDLIIASSNVIENSKKIKGIMRSYEINMQRIGFNYTQAKDIVKFSLAQVLTFDEKKKVFIELIKHDNLYECILDNIFGIFNDIPNTKFIAFAECDNNLEDEQLFDILFEKIIKSKKDSVFFLHLCNPNCLSGQLNCLNSIIQPECSTEEELRIFNYLNDKFKRIYDEYGHDLIYSNKKFKHSTEELLLLIKHMTDEEILYIISILNTGLDCYDFEHNLAVHILRTTKFTKEIDAQGVLINLKNS